MGSEVGKVQDVRTPLTLQRNGHLYVLHALIKHGADPSIVDSQGFNALHLVVHSSVIMAVFYMLQQNVQIDAPDVQVCMLGWTGHKLILVYRDIHH